MSIQSEINRIAGAKSDIADAIEDKGVTVPSGTKLDGMANLIGQIPAGGSEKLNSTQAADAYDPTATYAVGDKVSYAGNVYSCISAISTPEAWDSTHWDQVDPIQDQVDEVRNTIDDIVIKSDNLIDPDNFEFGTISSTGGNVSSGSYKRSIDYISVLPSTYYAFKNIIGICQYKSDKTFISRTIVQTEGQTNTIQTNQNAYYIKVIITEDYFDSALYLNEGNSLKETPYHASDYLGDGISLVSKNPYFGKKMASIGDSITLGFKPRNDSVDAGVYINSYAKVTAKKLGMAFANYGIRNSTVANVADHDPMSRRYSSMPDDADVITFMGGANDIRMSVPLGTNADRTDDTFYGALHVLFSGLYKKYYIDQGLTEGSKKKIIAITPLKMQWTSPSETGGNGTLYALEPYVEAIKTVADYYSFPCLDMYNLSQLNPSVCCTLQGTDPLSSGIYTIYQTDGTHPVQAAANMMAELLSGFLLSLGY